ncbi:MgtC/SapB family protein [Zavarzinia sp. CC-PAN008]|uniref:MgtC/SapB family protein n=1 Tax=Zavarzinia sp. CC-PAN008 TaxID=3243332 RepID=UPI003F74662D
MLAGAVLGIDREVRGKAAGLRTHMLIGIASAAMTMVSMELGNRLPDDNSAVRGDPIRAVDAVVAALGFLAAGIIIRGESGVRGLTTAATIWTCGAIGVACGAGLIEWAAIVLGFAVFVVTALGMFEGRLSPHGRSDDEDPDPPRALPKSR